MQASDFSLSLTAITAPENHLAVSSGYATVHPAPRTVCGIGECYSPPFAARGLSFALAFTLDGHRIADDGNYGKGDCGLLCAGGEWRPDYILRRGTYHHRIQGRLLSLRVETRLAALPDRPGAILEVKLLNRSGRPLPFALEPQVRPGNPALASLDTWSFHPPAPGAPARPLSPRSWGNDDITLHLLADDAPAQLETDGEIRLFFSLVLARPATPPAPDPRWRSALEATVQAWEKRLADVATRLPLLQSDLPGLADFYRRSLISGLVCIWEHDAFATRPFLATCGMDGGAICAYPWDTCGYAPHALSLLLGDRIDSIVRLFDTADILHHSRVTPSGRGIDVPYAYNAWSIITFLQAASCHRGPTLETLAFARRLFDAAEHNLPVRDELADFGVQHNLLEMRGLGWEHTVPSPNAERAWSLDRLADQAEALGLPAPADWRPQAARIRAAIQRHLWNHEKQWFDCLYPDGHREQVYSIQAYDALRHGCCTPAMETALLGHLRDGAFLGPCGVSSVSAEDSLHYEINDPDWSGGGSYFGDGLNLAQTLWELGHPERAWDILQRYFWMGRHLPYFPQEAFCDRPAVPAHKRANIISGLCGVETILFGMLGLRLTLDGHATFQPAPVAEGFVAINGLLLRGHRVDLSVEPGRISATVDGRTTTAAPGATLPLF